jgi:hypothetical protein
VQGYGDADMQFPGDFDGDGYGDLAIGVPFEEEVHVLYGSADGLSTLDQVLSQDTFGMQDSLEEGDDFGSVLATGDFNGDGFDDLAIGVPGEVPTGYSVSAGAVVVVFGSEDGLDPMTNAFLTQATSGIPDGPADGDGFGSALAAGDFNCDFYADLAIGAPGENLDGYWNAGAVHVFYGTAWGLSPSGSDSWYQDDDIAGSAEDYDSFGWALAAGDFDDDGKDDLAIGVPHENIDDVVNAGAVNILYGKKSSSVGLATDRNVCWHRDDSGISGVANAYAEFGAALGSSRTGTSQPHIHLGTVSAGGFWPGHLLMELFD